MSVVLKYVGSVFQQEKGSGRGSGGGGGGGVKATMTHSAFNYKGTKEKILH